MTLINVSDTNIFCSAFHTSCLLILSKAFSRFTKQILSFNTFSINCPIISVIQFTPLLGQKPNRASSKGFLYIPSLLYWLVLSPYFYNLIFYLYYIFFLFLIFTRIGVFFCLTFFQISEKVFGCEYTHLSCFTQSLSPLILFCDPLALISDLELA